MKLSDTTILVMTSNLFYMLLYFSNIKITRLITDALKPSEVADLMTLHKLTSRKWYIQAACAKTGEGLFEAMREMSKMVKEFKAKSR